MDQTGNFGAAAGGISPELQAALSRRQNPGANSGAMGQVTQGAPTFDPSIQPGTPPTGGAPMPGGQPPMPGGDPMAQAPAAPSLPFDASEASVIIKAMDSRLKSLSKLQGA